MNTSKSSASSPLPMPAWRSGKSLSPEMYLSDQYIVLDFEVETNRGDWGNPVFADNRLLLACWKVGPQGSVECCWGTELEQQRLADAIRSCRFIVAHNAKYECGWLHRAGSDLRSLAIFDTQIAAYLARKGRADSVSLDAVARRAVLRGK